MVNEIVELRVSKVVSALKKLEESGELVLTSSNLSSAAKVILDSLGVCLDQALSESELNAVMNSMNAILNGVKVDDFDFSTIIGTSNNELIETFEKLKKVKENVAKL